MHNARGSGTPRPDGMCRPARWWVASSLDSCPAIHRRREGRLRSTLRQGTYMRRRLSIAEGLRVSTGRALDPDWTEHLHGKRHSGGAGRDRSGTDSTEARRVEEMDCTCEIEMLWHEI